MTDCDTSSHPFHAFFKTFAAPFGEPLKLRSESTDFFAEMTTCANKLRIVYRVVPRHELFFFPAHIKGKLSALGVYYNGNALTAADWAGLIERCNMVRGFPEDVLTLIRQVAGEDGYQGKFQLYGM